MPAPISGLVKMAFQCRTLQNARGDSPLHLQDGYDLGNRTLGHFTFQKNRLLKELFKVPRKILPAVFFTAVGLESLKVLFPPDLFIALEGAD